MKKSFRLQSGNLLVSLLIVVLIIIVGITVYVVQTNTGFLNRATSNKSGEELLSAGLLETSGKKQTLDLLELSKNSPNSKNNPTLTEASATREKTMLALLKKDPNAFLKIAMPAKISTQLPKEIQSRVEQEMSVEGVLMVSHADDFKNNKDEIIYDLSTNEGTRLRLYFPSDPEEIVSTQTRLNLQGYKLGSNFVVRSLNKNDLKVVSQGNTEAIVAPTIKKLAVILLNFSNDQSQPWTKEDIKKWTFTDPNSLNAYYKESSYGRWGVQGDVFGYFTIKATNDPCDYYLWKELGMAAAQNAGMDPNNYTNFMFAFPSTGTCWFGGLGNIGGPTSWINGTFSSWNTDSNGASHFIPIHELGHNFGLEHANSYRCVDENNKAVAISTNCQSSEYDDPFDAMGRLTRQFNNAHKDQLRWLTGEDFIKIKNDGVYTLIASEKDSKKNEIIRIPRTKDSSGRMAQFYYLEYRQTKGVFDNFSSNDPVLKGVSIRLQTIYVGERYGSPALIDTTPETYFDFYDAPLAVGKVFDDKSYGIKIKTLSVGQNASVRVNLYPPVCLPAKPTIYLSPIGQWGRAGEELSYFLQIRNNDSSACPKSVFTIASTLFNGWQQRTLSGKTVIEALPGDYGQETLFIRSSNYTPQGYYSFTENIRHSAGTKYSSALSANYNVYMGDYIAPIVTINSPMSGEIIHGVVYPTISATDNIAVNKVEVYVDGNYSGLASSDNPGYSYPWYTTYITNGTHQLSAKAYDPAGNEGVSSVVTVEVQNK